MREILVAGGGLAGAAAALQLVRAGREVILIEKESGPHDKVCGEFISQEAMAYLSMLGVDIHALGAVNIDKVRFAVGDSIVERKLPFASVSLSRRVLDDVLLRQAEDAGVTVRRGLSVQKIDPIDGGWRAQINDSLSFDARDIFLASGKHDVRGQKRPSGKQNDLVAFKMHWHLAPQQAMALAGAVELFLFPGGYGGLESIEDGKANLCFLIQQETLARHGGRWDDVLRTICESVSFLAQRLDGAAPSWEKPLAISAIPYGYVRRDSEGLWRLGDQAAVIPSFSGDGMAIALHSAALATTLYLKGGKAMHYQTQLARDLGRQVDIATTISRTLVAPFGQRLCGLAGFCAPSLIAVAARMTRIPDRALLA